MALSQATLTVIGTKGQQKTRQKETGAPCSMAFVWELSKAQQQLTIICRLAMHSLLASLVVVCGVYWIVLDTIDGQVGY
jgi:hypothetical protein